jgi:hypothetical protein
MGAGLVIWAWVLVAFVAILITRQVIKMWKHEAERPGAIVMAIFGILAVAAAAAFAVIVGMTHH